jgi:putative glycosyltransferase (TIGR04372 family)
LFHFLRKLKGFLQKFVLLPFIIISIPLVIVVRIIRPLVWIRFGPVRSDVIGHSVFDPEYYLSESEVENNKCFDFFYFQTNDHPNEQWYLMVTRTIMVNPLFRYLDLTNQLIPGGRLHHKVAGIKGSRDPKGYLAKTKPHFSFTEDENKRGFKFLESLGVKKNAKFICLLGRDSSFKNKHGDKRDWSYHNYRDTGIETFKEAAIYMADKDYFVIRMGKSVKKLFKVKHHRIFDYANSKYRCDYLDIWLMANCYFLISVSSGLEEVTRIFRKPTVTVNYIPIQQVVSYDHVISVPKHLVWEESNQRLSLTEHLNISYLKSEQYKKAGIIVENLSEQEILEAVIEMEARLNNKWNVSSQDIQLQIKFWNIIKTSQGYKKYHGLIHPEARVGTHFLKNNLEWLQ